MQSGGSYFCMRICNIFVFFAILFAKITILKKFLYFTTKISYNIDRGCDDYSY